MLKRIHLFLLVTMLGFCCAGMNPVMAQDAEEKPAGALEFEGGEAPAEETSGGFWSIVTGGGFFGGLLWLLLAVCSIAGVALIVDSFVTIREKKIAPETLILSVQEAMEQGDVMKALECCEVEPGPLANVLSAGFGNVQEGFEVIQDSVAVAADMESEKLLQRVNYLNVVGNLAPMLGLLGTVAGMIFAFKTLGTAAAGAAQQSMLALNISMALWTTAAGLLVAVPTIGFFHYFRNRAMNIILGMEALTMTLMKDLRNVEVIEE